MLSRAKVSWNETGLLVARFSALPRLPNTTSVKGLISFLDSCSVYENFALFKLLASILAFSRVVVDPVKESVEAVRSNRTSE